MGHIKMQRPLGDGFNGRAVVARCCSEGGTSIMPWKWFNGRTVFGNSALTDLPHSHVDGRSAQDWFDGQAVFGNLALRMCRNTNADERTARGLV